MEGIFELIDSVLAFLESYWIAIVVSLAIVATAVLWGTSATIRGWKRKRLKLPKPLYKELEALLSLEALVELFAPHSRYIQTLPEGGKASKQLAILSPFSRAVKASAKRVGKLPETKIFRVRRQIAEAAKRVEVAPLTERQQEEILSEEEGTHFNIIVKLDGNDPEKIRKLKGAIAGQLGLHTITEEATDDAFSLSFLASKQPRVDRLTELAFGAEFFEEHPAQTPYSLPLAVKANGKPWSLPVHHTLILGATGSGKSSPLHGIIKQLTPFWEKERVKLYGIDPKASEFKPYKYSALFSEVSEDAETGAELIADIYNQMVTRAKGKKIDLHNADLGRSLEATKDNPMIILLIDELLSLLISFQQSRELKQAHGQLVQILAQGRSLGIYVVAATQDADKALLGQLRLNFANVILLRQTSQYFNDLFLGEGATERGYDSTEIGQSTKANGYKFSGIAYVKEETGKPVKVRFAYTSDKDLSALIGATKKQSYSDSTDDEEAFGGFRWED